MKRIFIYALSISFAIILAFTGIGIINYVNKQDTAYGDSVSAEIYELKNSMSDLYIDKEAYEEDLQELTDKIDYWIFEQEKVKNEQSGYQGELKELDLLIQNLQDQIDATLDNQLLLLQKAEYEADKVELEKKLAECDSTLAEIDSELTALNNKVDDIEEQLSTINTEIESLQSQINDLYARVNALNRNILTAYVAEYVENNGAEITLTLTSGVKVGSKLSVSGGKVVVGSGVSKVIVSGVILFKDMASKTETRYGSLLKNGTACVDARTYCESGGLAQLVFSPVLFSVSNGTTFTFNFKGANSEIYAKGGSSIFKTYLTVEVVE